MSPAIQIPQAWKPVRVPIPEGRKFPELRERDVTASIVACLFGEHDYISQWQLWQQRVNRALPPQASIYARIGNALEHSVAKLIEVEECMTIEKEVGYYREPNHRIGAMLDYWCYRWGDEEFVNGVPFDIKIVAGPAWMMKWKNGSVVPPSIAVQIIVQCALTGAKEGLVGAFVGGTDIHVIKVPFSQPLFQEVVKRVAAFHHSVAERIEPLPDMEHDVEAVIKLYRKTTEGKTVDLSKDNNAAILLESYAELKAEKAALDKASREIGKRLDVAKAELLVKMKDAQRAIIGPRVLLAKTTGRAGYTVQPTEYRTLEIEE